MRRSIRLAPGSYSGTQSVTLSDSTSGAYVCYKVASSFPSLPPQPDSLGGCLEGTLYSSPVSVGTGQTLYASAGVSLNCTSPCTPALPSTLVVGPYTASGVAPGAIATATPTGGATPVAVTIPAVTSAEVGGAVGDGPVEDVAVRVAAETPTATATVTGAIPAATPGAPLTAQVASTPALTSVNRIGVNTGANDNSGPGDFMANMFDNPGFEPITESHLIIVGGGATSSSFTDTSDPTLGGGYAPTKYPTGFWNGGKGSVRTGAAAGDQFTITSYTSNGSYTFGSCEDATGNPISCPTLAAGVGVAEVQTGPTLFGGMQGSFYSVANWSTSDVNCNYSTSQVYDGNGSLECGVADGGSHTVHYSWDYTQSVGGVCSSDNVTPCTVANENIDCGGGDACLIAPEMGPWHPVKGAFEIAFYALGSNTSSGTPQVTVALARTGGTNVSHTFALTNDGNWHQYVYDFTGTDTAWTSGSEMNPLIFSLTTNNNTAESGGAIYIDDAYLGKPGASSTGFRSEFVATMQAINPGSIRLMEGGTMAAPRINLEGINGCKPGQGAGPDTPGTCDFQHGPADTANTYGGQWTYSSADLYPLANQFSAAPWLSISNAFSDADLKIFIDNMCSALSTYSNIPSIWIEQSNEEWNTSSPSFSIKFGSGNLGRLGYGEEALRNFSIMGAEAASRCPSLASKIHYVLGEQACNAGIASTEIAGGRAAGYSFPNTAQFGIDVATYYGDNLPSYRGSLASQAAKYATLFFGFVPPYVGPPGTGCINNGLYSEYGTVGSDNTVSVYETGVNAYNGPGTTEQGYLSEGGYPSAAWMAESWLMTQQLGRTPIQNEFTLTQTELGIAPIWGIAHDLDSDFGPTFPHLRPIAMAEQLVNSAISGAYHPVKAPSGTVINAYQNADAWSAALVNTTASLITLTMEFPSSGTIPQTAEAVLNTNGITDNAENSNDVYVAALPGGLSTSGQNVTLTLPPFSVVAIH